MSAEPPPTGARRPDLLHLSLVVAVVLLLVAAGMVVAVRSSDGVSPTALAAAEDEGTTATAGGTSPLARAFASRAPRASEGAVVPPGPTAPPPQPRADSSEQMPVGATGQATATPTPAPTVAPPSPLPDLPTDRPTTPPDPPPTAAEQRVVWQTDLVPFATVGGVDVHHPAMFVERIGLHQSNHEGARDLTLYDSAAAPMVMESRGRLSGLQSAADIVVDPAAPIVAPVTGVVVRGGTYTLYCDNLDEFVVIVPDAQQTWEVKLLHLVGLQVTPGQRVEAGVTPLAQGARTLPFRSQVDDHTAEPSWPHTHLEVVDTAIPNQPNAGSGSSSCS